MIQDFKRSSEFDLDSSIFASFLILAFGAISLISLIGFPKPEYDYFLICGLGLLFVNFSVVIKAIFGFQESPGIDGLITVLVLFLSLIASFLPQILSSIVVLTLASIGYVCLVFVLWRSTWKVRKMFFWIIIPGLLSLWVAGFQYASTFPHPLYLEKVALGIINHDQIYHTSITEIIRTYLVPSTGLQGTPYVPYHFGSHIVMAMFSNLLDISALESYNILFPVIIIPLYFRVALFVVKDLVRAIFGKEEVVSDLMFWMLFSVLTIGIIPNEFASEKWAIWDSWMISESYLFSLIFLFFAISLTIAITSGSSGKRQVIVSVLLIIVLFLMALSKISVIIVAAGAGIYMIVRTQRWRTIWGLSIALIVFAIVLFSVKVGTRHSVTSQPLVPLHFIKEWVPQATRVFFIPVFYFSLIVYALLRIKEKGAMTMSNLASAIRSKQFVDIEFLIVSALLGLAPALAFPIENGSGWYFLDIQSRLAFVFLAAFLLAKRTEECASITLTDKPAISSFFARYSFVSLVAIVLVLNNVFSKFEDLLNVNLKLRLAMIQLDTSQSKYYGDYTDVYKYFQGDRKQLGQKLSEISYLPGKIVHDSEKFNYYKWLSDTCSTIERKNQLYFKLRQDSMFFKTAHRLDWAAPFIVPSLTGIALTNGVPESTKDFNQYGYVSYKNLKTDSTQCSESLGKQVLILEPFKKAILPCK